MKSALPIERRAGRGRGRRHGTKRGESRLRNIPARLGKMPAISNWRDETRGSQSRRSQEAKGHSRRCRRFLNFPRGLRGARSDTNFKTRVTKESGGCHTQRERMSVRVRKFDRHRVIDKASKS
ncbi:uncharacterized protein LOC105425593 [Pogonomyrmex barbatus]|uniref:Uncharacterized protein LOC105425593 n=1 Tax=Pogonomyrmex barbatus TaxID=144034 RepID=A0A6I9WS67_9HYME|nr:uncharacterized protein LOC105425593 [Pogonomyrmex barbatus]